MDREAPSRRLRRGAAARVRTLLGLLLLVLVAGTAGVSGDNKTATVWNGDSLVSALEQQASVLYARGARLLNDARLLYEIRSLLREPNPGAAGKRTSSEEPAKTCNKRLVNSAAPNRAEKSSTL